MAAAGGVLTCIPAGAYVFYLRGIKNAFKLIDVSCVEWDGSDAMLRAEKPKLYLGCAEAYRQVVPEWCRREFGTKVLYHMNPYGSVRVGSVGGGPVIDAKDQDIKWALAQKPDGIYCYADGETIKTHYNHWTDRHGIKVHPMPLAADTEVFKLGEERPALKFDIGWVGGYWPYKSKMLDVYLVPLRNRYRCGFYGWNDHWKMGPIADHDVRHVFSNAAICPAVSEPHTVEHAIDVPERVFKVPCAGGFTIHTPTKALDRLGLSEVIPVVKNPTEWFEKIDFYLKNHEARKALAAKQRRKVLEGHTYLHRITSLVADFFPEKMEALKQAKRSLL
ncbi:MAG: glycosyltransferase [Candidatus Nanopelagicaceae bacterium]|nr:glycosyltransferase [Candidatus Nanopelagicaceae bacterium]